jgi:hypothetical protein
VRIRPIFRWYDFWVGAYLDRARHRLYVLPLPMLGVCIEWGPVHIDAKLTDVSASYSPPTDLALTVEERVRHGLDELGANVWPYFHRRDLHGG